MMMGSGQVDMLGQLLATVACGLFSRGSSPLSQGLFSLIFLMVLSTDSRGQPHR